MSSLFILALGAVLLSSLLLGIQSQGELDPVMIAHEGHGHDPTLLIFIKEGGKRCRAQFNPDQMEDWIRISNACANHVEYQNTEEVPIIQTFKDYSRYYSHDDKCFHHCVYYYMDFLEDEPGPLINDADHYIDDIEILGYKYVTEQPDSPIYHVGFQNNLDKRQYKSSDITQACDKAARYTIAEVYGYIPPRYDNATEIKSKDQPPFSDTQCAYGNLFAYCVHSFYGNHNILNYEASYIYCLDRIIQRYLFYDLCIKYYKEDNCKKIIFGDSK